MKLSSTASFIWSWYYATSGGIGALALTPSGGVMVAQFAGDFGASGIVLAP